MMTDVGASQDVAEGQAVQYAVGDYRITVVRLEGQLYAIDAVCPHRGAFLTRGTLREGVLYCPWHCWGFDVRTGEGVTNPMSKVRTYVVREENGRVLLETDMQ